MGDTRKQTAFRLDRGLLELVDAAVAGGRAANRTAAVELALRGWLASGSVVRDGSVVADSQPRDVVARSVEVSRTERIERAQAVPGVQLASRVRPAQADWMLERQRKLNEGR